MPSVDGDTETHHFFRQRTCLFTWLISNGVAKVTDRLDDVDRPRVETILPLLPEGGSILDIGCAQHDAGERSNPNWLHQHLYEIGNEVLGIDYLEEEIAELREAGYNVEHQNAETMDLGREFDTIVAGELIEHLSNFGQFLDRVHDHLLPGGALVLSTPNPWALHRFYQAFQGEVYSNPEHTCWFDERTLRQTLKRHDFEVESVAYVEPPAWGVRKMLYKLDKKKVASAGFSARAVPD